MRQLLVGWMLVLAMLASPLAIASEADLLVEADFPTKLQGQLPVLERKNQAILTYMWMDVYAAAFYAEPSINAQQSATTQTPQRLELYYFRDIDREDIIKTANTTLERQQTKETLRRLRPELDRLHNSFQSVRPGDRYDLSWDPTDGMTVTRNEKVIFASPDPELAKVYLALWLAPDGLSENLRAALLN
ncbi:MAG TPA: chalcone isomerase family protein [Pseudomonas sp.]|uniref:chalcone isomerase family protein n=1 Tax=Pseudomonas sp. TaxID=306 RepID=UPI002EDA6949